MIRRDLARSLIMFPICRMPLGARVVSFHFREGKPSVVVADVAGEHVKFESALQMDDWLYSPKSRAANGLLTLINMPKPKLP